MQKYIVTCCSPVDLSLKELNDRNIPFIACSININGQLYKDDYVTYPIDKFYEDMKNGIAPSTSQANMNEYMEFFKKYLEEGYDIFHLCVSSGVSGTINSCMNAIEELKGMYSNKVYCLDTLSATSGYGLLVLLAKDNLDKGMPIEENYKDIEEKRMHLHHWFFTSDLTYFIRGGRISKAAGLVGGALQICPLMTINKQGKAEPVEKVRTKTKAMKMAIEKMKEYAQDGLNYSGPVIVNHSACLEDAEMLVKMIKETFVNVKEVKVFIAGAAIGSHAGPGAVGMYYLGTERK